jgi:hypothetical protein
MTTLTFTILYHKSLKSKTSDRILIEIKDLLKDNRFSPDTKFSYENSKDGITISIDFTDTEHLELYLSLLKGREFFLANTLLSKY